MKNIILLLTLTISFFANAQKDQIKLIQKSYKKGEFQETIKLLNEHKELLQTAPSKYKKKYEELNLSTYIDLYKKEPTEANTDLVIKALSDTSSDDVKQKFNTQITSLLKDIEKAARDYYNNKNNDKASKYFNYVYRLSPKDTVFLYNAALIATADKNLYDRSIDYYKELIDIGYDGAKTNYMAKEISTGEVQHFANKSDRDLRVQLGTHKEPTEEEEPSKKSELYKNIALLYVSLNKKDKALELEALDLALKNLPNDPDLVLQKSHIYLVEAYDLYEKKEFIKSEELYKKSLSIKPDYVNAALGLSSLYLGMGNQKLEEVDKITASRKRGSDSKIDALNSERLVFYQKAADVLIDIISAVKTEDPGEDVYRQLKNIYAGLGNKEKMEEMKEKLKQYE